MPSPKSRSSTSGPSAATPSSGVIGDPVAHSLSPLLHNTAFAEMGLDWVSVGFRVTAGHTGEALAGARELGLRGLSVTMPHKEAAAGLIAGLSPLAERLGAVNCVAFGSGPALGDNTDGPGLVAALRHAGASIPKDGDAWSSAQEAPPERSSPAWPMPAP